jgi:uncharacterized phage protein gp47/JayE
MEFGVTPAGFVPMQQQDVIDDLDTAAQQQFGQNVNTGAEAVLGQLIGILSERFALLWQLGQAIYTSQYPNGAEGTSVDNILALNNLKRLPATPTVTNPEPLTNGTTLETLYGLVLFGTPGTIVPAGAIINTSATPPVSFSLDNPVTINSAINAIQSIFFSNTPNVGAFVLTLTDQYDNSFTTESIAYNALANQTQLLFSGVPGTGNYQISLTQAGVVQTTAAIPYTDSSGAALQAAIQALTGYSGVTVSGNFTSGFVISWGAICNPLVTQFANTLGVTLTPVDSVQTAINNIFDDVFVPNFYPYTDVTCGALSPGFTILYGTGTPIAPNPASSSMQQAITTVASNTLQFNTTVTNVAVANTQIGSAALGIGSATASVDGPNFVSAGSLTVIGSPTSGWNSVNNQLDCLTGTNVEDDTEALTRRSALLNATANGPLQSIIEKVSQVPGVTAVKGFENLNEAALQNITITGSSSSGTFQLAIGVALSTTIPFSPTALQIQTALQTISGFNNTLVTGSTQTGFTVDFNGAQGGQPQPLMTVTNNTTGQTITLVFGRPGKSFEIVAQGGSDMNIATAIFGAKPAGIQAYGSTVVTVEDAYGNPYAIGFSRPTEVPIYVVLTLITDTYNVPGNSGSGLNPNAQFTPSSIQTIQQEIATIGNEVPIGGTVIGFGTNGLIGAFNNIPGIVDYTLYFGVAPSPATNTNIPLLPEQLAEFETFNIQVSYT